MSKGTAATQVKAFLLTYWLKLYRLNFFVALLISIVLFMAAGNLGLKALQQTALHQGRYKPTSHLELFRFFMRAELIRFRVAVTAPLPLTDAESPLMTYHISIKEGDYSKLTANLPKSGKERYYNAYMRVGGGEKVQKIKLRFRGDNNFHWFYPQKSLRIKTEKDEIHNLQRSFNLINAPEDKFIVDIVTYEAARKLGIIAPDFYPARVFLNGTYMGVYLYLSQADESLIRKHKRMPGSIYSGDLAPTNKTTGVSLLWFKQRFWIKKGARNAEQKKNREDIVHLIKAVQEFDDLEFYEFARTLINKEAFYNFFAIDTLTGSPHHDYGHNHKIYFDPYLGKFEPIEWDIRAWSTPNWKENFGNPLLNRFVLNPILEFERDQVLFKVLNSDAFSVEARQSRVDYHNQLFYEDLRRDIYKDDAMVKPEVSYKHVSTPYTMQQHEKMIRRVKVAAKSRTHKVLRILKSAKGSYLIKPQGRHAQVIFQLQGNSPIYVDLKSGFAVDSKAKIYRDLNFNGRLEAIEKNTLFDSGKEILYPGRLKQKGTRIKGASKQMSGDYYIKEAPLYYSYIVTGAVSAPAEIAGTNAITGAKL
ncbi:MAG: CotH kinase family protein, partial [SAR324 cluster bacterium]|nr:CotH kinase family protein [SAR324 cluster bacterium]